MAAAAAAGVGQAAVLPTLQLYRAILKAAKQFPSIKRHSIIQRVRDEFRQNKELHDPAKLQHCRAVAERGLSDLQAYAAMSRTADGGSYSINLKGATS